MGALVIEELDCLGVPERVDALPGVGFADHVDHAVDRDSAVGVGDAGGLAAAVGAVLGEGRDGFRVGWLGSRCGVPCLLRGDPSGQALVGAFGVVELIERVDLFLKLFKAPGEGLFVQETEQGPVEAFVLALCGWFVGFPGDRLDPQGGNVREELALAASP
ncbi:hypothetical protein SRABI26_04697 [Arthrobacter sp. Bi26]|nr:hypothetical protein SRABI26_04697 [Arthrobacter sp. Bi26]